jgi:hypothetical protein
MDGIATPGAVADASALVGWKGVTSTWVEVFDNIQHLGPYFGTIIPVACTSAAGTLMCWNAARANGDTFNLRETMVIDGIGTMIASLFGCPFGTTVYLGHSAYKAVGARSGYSLINAATFFLVSLTGLFALIRAIVPIQAVAPIILFVGLSIGADAISAVPFRHVAPVVFGLLPGIGNWALNVRGALESNRVHSVCVCVHRVGVPLVTHFCSTGMSGERSRRGPRTCRHRQRLSAGFNDPHRGTRPCHRPGVWARGVLDACRSARRALWVDPR